MTTASPASVSRSGLLYDGALQPVAATDDAGSVTARYVQATQAITPDVMIGQAATYRVISDHLGSVRLLVDIATGAIAQRLDYDEYGVVTADSAPGAQPFGFAGGVYDPVMGLVRFGARDYDATTGRWIAKDPILFRGDDTDLYAYTAKDPVNRVDPSGWIPFVNTTPNDVWVRGGPGPGGGHLGPQESFPVPPGGKVDRNNPYPGQGGPITDVDGVDLNGDGLVDSDGGLMPPFGGEKIPGVFGQDWGLQWGLVKNPCAIGPPLLPIPIGFVW